MRRNVREDSNRLRNEWRHADLIRLTIHSDAVYFFSSLSSSIFWLDGSPTLKLRQYRSILYKSCCTCINLGSRQRERERENWRVCVKRAHGFCMCDTAMGATRLLPWRQTPGIGHWVGATSQRSGSYLLINPGAYSPLQPFSLSFPFRPLSLSLSLSLSLTLFPSPFSSLYILLSFDNYWRPPFSVIIV